MPASKSATAPKAAGSPGPTSNSRLRLERENSNKPAILIPHPAATKTTVAIRNALPGGHSHQLGDTFSVDLPQRECRMRSFRNCSAHVDQDDRNTTHRG